MAAGPKIWTEERIAERFAQGRGQGTGESYVPWVLVQEFASRGNQTRVPSVRMRRSIHTFSYLERAMYFWHEYHGFLDYREQLPLDRRITLGAAQLLRVPHPVYPVSRVPFVMMVDALIVRYSPQGGQILEGWDAKPAYKLRKPRVRQKLMLHLAACKYSGISHQIFSENSVPKSTLRNIEWARGGLPLEDEWLNVPELFTLVADEFQVWLGSRRHRRPIWELCTDWDNRHRYEWGTSLRLFKFLLWNQRISIDLSTADIPHALLPYQRTREGVTHVDFPDQRRA